jgi:hypothetical protein
MDHLVWAADRLGLRRRGTPGDGVKRRRWLVAAGGAAGGLAAAYLAARRLAESVARRTEDIDADTADLPGERLYLHGRRIHLMLDGEGPPPLIHGFAASAAAFRRIALASMTASA